MILDGWARPMPVRIELQPVRGVKDGAFVERLANQL
jgi:hypothetical protein